MFYFLKVIFVSVFVLVFGAILFLSFGFAPTPPKITWGIDFSKEHAKELGLDWKKTYLAMLDDLGAKHVKLHVRWNSIEASPGQFNFTDIDWQINQAASRGAKVIYVVGVKTGRWPECHDPKWSWDLSPKEHQDKAIRYVRAVIDRYKDNLTVIAWQAENEPLFKFGQCPGWYYDGGGFLRREVAAIKSIDARRPVIVSDAGELSLWGGAARAGDQVGITMYKKIYVNITDTIGFGATYYFPAVSYWRRAKAIEWLFGKKVICVELQAEPWSPVPYHTLSLAEQEKTMNIDQFKANVAFAKNTGLDTFYFWGAEYWYWLKAQGHPEIWQEARKLFARN